MSLKRIINKGVRLSEMSTLAGIFALQNVTEEELKLLKLSIRNNISPKMKNYFFDSIVHIIDSEEIGIELLTRYGCGINRNKD